jgi:hypothetical protein
LGGPALSRRQELAAGSWVAEVLRFILRNGDSINVIALDPARISVEVDALYRALAA